MTNAQFSDRERRPWEGLDARVGELIEPLIAPLAEEITAAIATSIPEYRLPMGGAFGRGVRDAIEETLRQFTSQIGRPTPPRRPGREVYVALGRGEYRAGRALDALQGAYRLGARIAWRRSSEAVRAAGLDGATLSLLAEAIFAYIDEVSAESVDGYASAQAAGAGERQRLRGALVLLAIQGEPDAQELAAAASRADWPLPRTLAALAGTHRDAERFAALAGEGAIAVRVGELVCALIADPQAPGRQARLATALAGRTAAIGPSVAPQDAGRSWARAARCVELAREGVLAADRLLEASAQLGALVLHADRPLLGELAAARLAPLDGLTAAARRRLEATLAAWLARQGNVAAVAADLHVHPQTVRYRLAALERCFGDALADPDARFELALALRASPYDRSAPA